LESRNFRKGNRVFASDAPLPAPPPAEKSRPRDQEDQHEEPVGHRELDLVGVPFPVHSLGKEGLAGGGGGIMDPDEAFPPGTRGGRPSEFDEAGGVPGAEVEARGHPKEAVEVMLRSRPGPA